MAKGRDVSTSSSSIAPFIDSVEGEISFFRSVMRARPVGIHRHFHVLAIQNAILKDTGQTVPIDAIWEKLKGCYDLEALEDLVSKALLLVDSSINLQFGLP